MLALDPSKKFFSDPKKKKLRLLAANMYPTVAFALNKDTGNAAESVTYEFSAAGYEGEADSCSSSSLLSALSKHSLFDDFFDEYISANVADDYTFAGISVPFFTQCETAMRLGRALKKHIPGIHVTLGGNHVGLHLSLTENPDIFKYADSLIAGDGELPILSLSSALAEGGNISAVQGIVYAVGGKVIRNSSIPITSPEDVFPPEPIFDRARYINPTDDYLTRIRFSEGCSWARCAFCNLPHSSLYPLQRPDENIMFEKLKTVCARGDRRIYFGDDESDPAVLRRFAERVIREKLQIRWSTNIRFSKKITLEWAELMRRSGCRCFTIGVESFDDRLLALMRKGTNRKLIENCLENLAWGGVPVIAYIIIGLPSETEEEARTSFEVLCEKIKTGQIKNAIYSVFNVSAGSEIYCHPQDFGVTLNFPPKDIDLRPHISDFSHSGMMLADAHRLQSQFTAEIADIVTERDFKDCVDEVNVTVNGIHLKQKSACDRNIITFRGEKLHCRDGLAELSKKAGNSATPAKFVIVKE